MHIRDHNRLKHYSNSFEGFEDLRNVNIFTRVTRFNKINVDLCVKQQL